MVVPVMVSVVTVIVSVMMSIVVTIVVSIVMSVALTWFVWHWLGRPWFWRSVANGRPRTRSWFGSSHARFRRSDPAIAWFSITDTRIERFRERFGFGASDACERILTRTCDSAVTWFPVSNTRIEWFGKWFGFHCVIARERFSGWSSKSVARLLVVELGVNLFHRSAWLQGRTLMLHLGKRVLIHPRVCDTVVEVLRSLHRRCSGSHPIIS